MLITTTGSPHSQQRKSPSPVAIKFLQNSQIAILFLLPINISFRFLSNNSTPFALKSLWPISSYIYIVQILSISDFYWNETYQKLECYYSGTFTSINRIIYNWNPIFLLILCIMIWHRHTESTLRDFKMTPRRNILTISQNIYSSIAYLPNPSIKVPLEILS